MATSATCLTSGLARLAALFDELEKISEATAREEKKPTLKKWLKNTAIIAAGAGTGMAGAMVLDRMAGQHLGRWWNGLDPKTKKLLVGGALGATTIGSGMAAQKLMEERSKRDRE
jgi:hypothetical protein